MLDLYWAGFHKLTFVEALQKPIYWYAILLLLILVLCFVVLRKLRRELIVVFADEEGNVQITPNALHEIVKKSCDQITELIVRLQKSKEKVNSFD